MSKLNRIPTDMIEDRASGQTLASQLAQKATKKKADNAWVDVIEDLGAKGDGVTDSSSVINTYLSTNDNVTLFFPAGTYLLNLSIPEGKTVKLLGNGNTLLKSYDGVSPCIKYLGNTLSKKIIIDGLDFYVSNTESAISIKLNSRNATVTPYLYLKNCFIQCKDVYTGEAIALQYINNFSVKDCTVNKAYNKAGEKGISIIGCLNGVIENCKFEYVHYGAYIASTGSNSCEGIRISNTEFFLCGYSVYTQGTTAAIVLDVRVSNCMIDQILDYGVWMDGTQSVVIDNCYLGTASNAFSPTAECIKVNSSAGDTSNIQITNSTLIMRNITNTNCITLVGTSAHPLKHVTLSNLYIYNHNLYGILISDYTSYVRISGCNINTSSANANNVAVKINDISNDKITIINSLLGGNQSDLRFPYVNINNLTAGFQKYIIPDQTAITITPGSSFQNNTARNLYVYLNVRTSAPGTAQNCIIYMSNTSADVGNPERQVLKQIVPSDSVAGKDATLCFIVPPSMWCIISTSATIELIKTYLV